MAQQGTSHQSRSQDKSLNPQRIFQMAFGYSAPLMLEAALQHKVFDVLELGPKTAQELATATETSVRGMHILLKGLIALEVVTRDAAGRYSLTPESSAFLVSGKPSYFGAVLRHTSKQLLPKWLQLTEIVKTGKPARAVNQEAEGSAFFADFVEAIFPNSYPAASAVAEHLNVAAVTQPVKVLDLAAGSGVWGIALAQKSPRVHVTAVDWPAVLPVTKKVAARFGVVDRFTFSPGDLTSADFGSGHQIATLGHILHSEGEPRSRSLLKKAFAALAPGGTIVVAEMLPDDDHLGPPHALIFSVNMLVNTDAGDTYTFGEISAWLKEAGFVSPRKLDTPGASPVILANKPS
jgi:3-hydroxy-5-methyl-1-naphthoate 3-O-methyltransferase